MSIPTFPVGAGSLGAAFADARTGSSCSRKLAPSAATSTSGNGSGSGAFPVHASKMLAKAAVPRSVMSVQPQRTKHLCWTVWLVTIHSIARIRSNACCGTVCAASASLPAYERSCLIHPKLG